MGYPSDLTDEEWARVRRVIPDIVADGQGRKNARSTRSVLNAILYKSSTDCGWNVLPKDFPSKSVVHAYFQEWDRRGVVDNIFNVLRRPDISRPIRRRRG